MSCAVGCHCRPSSGTCARGRLLRLTTIHAIISDECTCRAARVLRHVRAWVVGVHDGPTCSHWLRRHCQQHAATRVAARGQYQHCLLPCTVNVPLSLRQSGLQASSLGSGSDYADISMVAFGGEGGSWWARGVLRVSRLQRRGGASRGTLQESESYCKRGARC